MPNNRHTPAGASCTRLIIETFRLNGRLLAAGDDICRDLGLTSARWQVMGAVADSPLPVAHIARNMGLTRQAVQRVADELAAEGFVTFTDNPHHRRAKLVGLSASGRSALAEIGRRQVAWANRLAEGLELGALDAAADLAAALHRRLAACDPDDKET